jgi:tetratricopeptide (TPR) repeat protein
MVGQLLLGNDRSLSLGLAMFSVHKPTKAVVVLILAVWAVGIKTTQSASPGEGAVSAQEGRAVQEKSPQEMDQHVRVLIERLGSDDYFARQRAQEELIRLGAEAFDLLTDATTHEDLEIAARAKSLLHVIREKWLGEGDLQGYEALDAENRLVRMQSLGEEAGDKGVASLCRLVRFEPSPVLAKSAALQLLSRGRGGDPPSAEYVGLLREHLGSSRRPGARWLMIFARYRDDPAKALAEWDKAAGEEEEVLRESPQQTEPRIVVLMRRMQIAWLDKRGRKDEAVAVMRRLIDLEKGDPDTLTDLVEWLMEQEAWKVLDEVAQKFAHRFAHAPLLLYAVAQSQAAQGEAAKAEETATRAFALNPGSGNDAMRLHAQVAGQLWRRRGLFAWAEREYRYVIEKGLPQHVLTIEVQSRLAEMLHDQGQDLKAADVLADCNKLLGNDRNGDEEIGDRMVKEIRSRMHYFYACYWQAQSDQAKARQSLDAAVAACPNDVDVLIACYRVTDATPEYRQKIRDLIRKAADEFREQINDTAEDSNMMNQFAWLIGNTEGDYDEALKYSKLSVQNNPEIGGFYDTLARVYYAKGNYPLAVEYQTKALGLDPHSGLIAKQLELFKKKLEEKK